MHHDTAYNALSRLSNTFLSAAKAKLEQTPRRSGSYWLGVASIKVVPENLTVWLQSPKQIIGIALNFPPLRDQGPLLMFQCVA